MFQAVNLVSMVDSGLIQLLILFQPDNRNVKLSIFGHKHEREHIFHSFNKHQHVWMNEWMNDVYLKRRCLGVAQVRKSQESRHKIIKKFILMIHHHKGSGALAHLLTDSLHKRIPPTSLDDIHEQSGNKYLS